MGNWPKSHLSQTQILQKVYDEDKDRLRIDGNYTSTIDGQLEVAIDSSEDSIAIKSPTTGNTLEPNADGSINVVLNGTPAVNTLVVSTFSTAAAVASGVETTIVTYTVPVGKTSILERLEFGGENVGSYNLYLNGGLINRVRTYFGGDFSTRMEFTGGSAEGLPLIAGDIIILRILHTRPFVGNFEGRIQTVLVG